MFRFAAHLEAQKAVKDVLAAVPRKVTVKGYLEGAVKVIVRVSLREILTRALNPRGGGNKARKYRSPSRIADRSPISPRTP